MSLADLVVTVCVEGADALLAGNVHGCRDLVAVSGCVSELDGVEPGRLGDPVHVSSTFVETTWATPVLDPDAFETVCRPGAFRR